jgi:hypothetical protein
MQLQLDSATVIRRAADLLSEENVNVEHDRALAELVIRLLSPKRLRGAKTKDVLDLLRFVHDNDGRMNLHYRKYKIKRIDDHRRPHHQRWVVRMGPSHFDSFRTWDEAISYATRSSLPTHIRPHLLTLAVPGSNHEIALMHARMRTGRTRTP